MGTISLSEIQNDYGTYQGNTLVGELGSVATIPNKGLDGIKTVDAPYLDGIVIQIDGVPYTDNTYLNTLKAANNPYIDITTLPTIVVSLNQLTSFGPEPQVAGYNGLMPQSQYAEVTGFSPMLTIPKIIQYLNDFFNPSTTDKTLSPFTLGVVGTPSPSEYFVDIDLAGGLYAGMQFEINSSAEGQVQVTEPPGDPVEVVIPEPIETEPVDVPEPVETIEPSKLPDVGTDDVIVDTPDTSNDTSNTGGGQSNGSGTGGSSGGSSGGGSETNPDNRDRFDDGVFDGLDTLREYDDLEGYLS